MQGFRKEFDLKHEVESMLLGTSRGLDKVAFLFRRGIGFNQFFSGIAVLHMTVNRSIQRGHKNILFYYQIIVVFMS
jgi:hypothetical protein